MARGGGIGEGEGGEEGPEREDGEDGCAHDGCGWSIRLAKDLIREEEEPLID